MVQGKVYVLTPQHWWIQGAIEAPKFCKPCSLDGVGMMLGNRLRVQCSHHPRSQMEEQQTLKPESCLTKLSATPYPTHLQGEKKEV